MNTIQPVRRTVLLVYEGLRLGFIIWAFMLLQPKGELPFPWLVLITPGAMFFLITLYWFFNIARYHLFSPIYLAGKSFGILTTALWIFFMKNDTIRELLFNSLARIIVPGIAIFLLLGDLLSIWIVVRLFYIHKNE